MHIICGETAQDGADNLNCHISLQQVTKCFVTEKLEMNLLNHHLHLQGLVF